MAFKFALVFVLCAVQGLNAASFLRPLGNNGGSGLGSMFNPSSMMDKIKENVQGHVDNVKEKVNIGELQDQIQGQLQGLGNSNAVIEQLQQMAKEGQIQAQEVLGQFGDLASKPAELLQGVNFMAKFQEMIQAVKEIMSQASASMRQRMADMMAGCKGKSDMLGKLKGLKGQFMSAVDGKVVSQMTEAIKQMQGPVFDQMQKMVAAMQQMSAAGREQFMNMMNGMKNKLGDIAKCAQTEFTTTGEEIAQIAENLEKTIETIVQNKESKPLNQIIVDKDALKALMSETITEISKELSNNDIGGVKTTIEKAAGQVQGIVADMEKAVKDIEGDMPELRDEINKAAQGAMKEIQDKAQSLVSDIISECIKGNGDGNGNGNENGNGNDQEGEDPQEAS